MSDERCTEGGRFHGSPPPVIPCGFGLWREHDRMNGLGFGRDGVGGGGGRLYNRSAIARKF